MRTRPTPKSCSSLYLVCSLLLLSVFGLRRSCKPWIGFRTQKNLGYKQKYTYSFTLFGIHLLRKHRASHVHHSTPFPSLLPKSQTGDDRTYINDKSKISQTADVLDQIRIFLLQSRDQHMQPSHGTGRFNTHHQRQQFSIRIRPSTKLCLVKTMNKVV